MRIFVSEMLLLHTKITIIKEVSGSYFRVKICNYDIN